MPGVFHKGRRPQAVHGAIGNPVGMPAGNRRPGTRRQKGQQRFHRRRDVGISDESIQLIAFGRHAQVMEIEELTALDARWDKGTNLHHGLLLANRFFRKHPNAQPVLLVVTDGEPTSHLESDGEVFFDYPPDPVTIAQQAQVGKTFYETKVGLSEVTAHGTMNCASARYAVGRMWQQR